MNTVDHRARAAKAEATAREARDAAVADERARWEQAVDRQPATDRRQVADYHDANQRLVDEEQTA